ncbi:MAG TPA: glycosyltransferase family 39 protein [Bryobacteraceae bacterium]|nr:glycosyltransferase family 39 protein [Bryobacteraceae bacterium]
MSEIPAPGLELRRLRWTTADLPAVIGMLVLIAIAIARVVPTYILFTQTFDEPSHIACGMEWLDQGTYTYERQHPPLARVAVALGPYLMGERGHGLDSLYREGNAILYAKGDYWRILRAARLGNLPFLVLACVVIFLWARRWFTVAAGLWAVLLFLSLPPILGHAGLATNDMACAASVAAALYQLMRWLEEPDWHRSIGFGAALSLALLTKFSAPVFVACCGVATVLYFALTRRDNLPSHVRLRPLLQRLIIVVGVTLVLVWAGYRFSLTTLARGVGPHPWIDRHIPSETLRSSVDQLVELPLPLADLARGFAAVYFHQERGHESYLLGRFSLKGWWYFFPIVAAIKTPIAFSLLAIAGVAIVCRRMRRSPWQHSLTALFPAAILLMCLSARINLGVRYILPIYPFLALMGGHAVSVAFQSKRRAYAAAAVLLAGSTVAVSWMAHPDYLAYFNPMAGSKPERILCDSDLDWGQDLNRLSQRLKSLGVEQLTIGYFGTALLNASDLPPHHVLAPDEKATGYVAISARYLYLDYARDGSYEWLRRHEPLERIGRSIYLYRIPN